MICADTSFLFSLYANDAHSRRAVARISRCRQALSISPFNEYELGNALRFAEFRKLFSPGMAANYWAQFEAAIAQKRLQLELCNLAIVLAEAKRLSSTYTARQGHRSFDILHVAAALHMGATEFLTFDNDQTRLAKAEGLKIPSFN